MTEYIEALPSGSYVAISHFFDPETPELSEFARRLEQVSFIALWVVGVPYPRPDQEHVPGLELVEPGLVPCTDWWPDGPRIKPMAPAQHLLVGAVGRKP